ncbi:hypothetical protein [Candidatus Enterococcus clewellii]|uniref:Uncharacterized protein n=1 Tax=Candidatus Enterococcus clewellii TaxID=1834193 RepID=A0A242KDK5_9ENTE|nr:hypothetical protein [Enterococcus sp. 9E7_DIV0242]OTP19251.1 hypothetical protein A5888_001066 [Enterococcus sp. 9E7_DIV0242]
MFGLGKRKDDQEYDEVYIYEDEEDYDEYTDYEEEEYNDRPQMTAKKKKEREGYQRYEDPLDSRREEEELKHEIDHLEETVERLTDQLEEKQEELYKVTNLLAEKENVAETASIELRRQLEDEIAQIRSDSDAVLREYKNHIEQLEDELADRKQQVRKQDNQVDSVKRTYENKIIDQNQQISELQKQLQQQDVLKNDLANIIIETKEQQREVIARAQWEGEQIRETAEADARKVLAESAMELHMVKQEAEKYRERLVEMKKESNHTFDRLIASAERVGQLEIRGGKFTNEEKRTASDHLPDISPVNRRASL